MMQGLYSQSTRKLVTQSAPASPAAKRDAAADSPRTPESGLAGTGGQNSVSGRVVKSSSTKKRVKKNDKRESTHDSMAILRELKNEGVGQEISNKSKDLTAPKKSDKKLSDIGGMKS